MKKIWSFALLAAAFVACGPAAQQEQNAEQAPTNEEVVETKVEETENVYPYHAGAEFDRTAAIQVAELNEKLKTFEGETMEVVLEADINSVCKKKGCWMKLDRGEEEADIRVSFKDYAFFVPLDANEHKTVVSGMVFKDTISVDHLKHLAEDAGESEEMIAKITEPEIVWAFEAAGVYVD